MSITAETGRIGGYDAAPGDAEIALRVVRPDVPVIAGDTALAGASRGQETSGSETGEGDILEVMLQARENIPEEENGDGAFNAII